MSRADLVTSVQQIESLVRPPEDVYYKELRTSYRRVRRFLPILLQTVAFGASPAGMPLIEAIDYLKTLEGDKKKAPAEPRETLTAANACLVAAQNRIPLVHYWGGEVASADGLRFVVPVRTVHAGPNPKYFGMGYGVTYYNLTSDQFTGLNGIVVPGTPLIAWGYLVRFEDPATTFVFPHEDNP